MRDDKARPMSWAAMDVDIIVWPEPMVTVRWDVDRDYVISYSDVEPAPSWQMAAPQ
jgi:hypothetical protein